MEAIHAEPKSIRQLFSHWEFSIPNFQRAYRWDVDHCDKLWENFESFCNANESDQPQFFLGSIVLYPLDSSKTRWQIIDGQQRLTTVLLLSKVMQERASTYETLEQLYQKVDRKSGRITGDLRLQLNKQEGNYDDFRTIMVDGRSSLDDDNKFSVNFDNLSDKFKNWAKGKSSKDIEDLIDSWMDRVVLLPIQCNTLDHALTIFNTVNDSGLPLNDADIFKGEIYTAIRDENAREEFVQQWDELYEEDSDIDHEYLFRIYMHILRARDGVTAKEIALRKYMMERWKENPAELREWQPLMRTLNVCRYVVWNSTHKKMQEQEGIYWAILSSCPNKYWEYPLYVFLHKHMEEVGQQGGWTLPEDKHAEYLKLMEHTTRYFFIKAVVHNSVNAVKDTTYKVCATIEKGESFLQNYAQSITSNDIEQLGRILQGANYGRCQKGLVLINSLCNDNQKIGEYAAFLQPILHSNSSRQVQIEHILPRKWWNNYDQWDEDLWKQHINLLGNLMPLEKGPNIAASNEFFSRKQEEYKKSKVQDALDLSVKPDKKWYPEDVQKRHAEAIERLMKFFGG